MQRRVFLRKGASRSMKKSVTSPFQAKRLFVALKALQSTPLEKLERTGAIRKLNVKGRDDVYSYRVGLRERIIFSPVGEDYIVHDILCVKKDNTLKSLMTDIKKRR